MNENSYLGSDVPNMEHDFVFEGEGKITKKRYVGEFTCRIPDTQLQCQIAKHRAFLNGPNADFLDPGTLKIHMQISYLRYTLLEYPKWWKNTDLGYQLVDHNIIGEVYDTVIEFEKKWLKEIWGDEIEQEQEEAEEGSSPEA